jgi:primosomal protein N'
MAYHLPKPPERCPRCGQFDCDEIPPGALERIAEALRHAPELLPEPHDFDSGPEPFI